MSGTVYIVHAIDTEGPLYESLDATFERIKDLFGFDLEPSYDTLEKVRNKELDLDGKEDIVAKSFDKSLLQYNDTWDKIDLMHSTLLSKEFRNKMTDSFGNGWVYNWFCLDHVLFETNPRRRDMGYLNIHDRYVEFLNKYEKGDDEIQWHFHPMSFYKEAHRCASSYENSPHLHQVLCRRIIERNFFPSSYRAGFQVIRPDSNWFLEQWIPFDCSSMAVENYHEFKLQNDFKNGRSGDWRGAPADWSIYHPDLYDWRKEGNLNRWIGRFLNINTRFANINQEETDKAFKKADNGENVLMGITNHDFRDMISEVESVRALVKQSKEKYPNVNFKFATTTEAFNACVNDGEFEKIKLDTKLYKEDNVFKLDIYCTNSEVFGPQPYLAIKTKSGRYLHDNLDFGTDGKSWFYVFDPDTVLSDDIAQIGIAANNKFGDTYVEVIDVE